MLAEENEFEAKKHATIAETNAKRSTEQAAAAKKSEHVANVRLYGSQIAAAKRELDVGDHGWSRLRLDQTQPEFRGWEYAYLDRINPIRATLKGHTLAVISVSFSPDGQRIVSGCMDGTIKVWDAESVD